MPVFNDPERRGRPRCRGAQVARRSIVPTASGIVPVFTDRQAFIRAAGLSGPEHASVLVLNRDGKVLARAEGRFDENKAQALRETLLARGD